MFKELLAPVWSRLQRPPSRHRPARRRCTTCRSMRSSTASSTSPIRASCRTRRAPASTRAASSSQTAAGRARSSSASPTSRRRSSTPKRGRLPQRCPTRISSSAQTRPSRCCARAGRDCRIVHIASHGYFRPENPMFSGIRLGDTYLNVYDLYRLRHAGRPGHAERLRDGRQRRGRGRRTARDYTRAVLRRRQDAAPQPVERPRREHRSAS